MDFFQFLLRHKMDFFKFSSRYNIALLFFTFTKNGRPRMKNVKNLCRKGLHKTGFLWDLHCFLPQCCTRKAKCRLHKMLPDNRCRAETRRRLRRANREIVEAFDNAPRKRRSAFLSIISKNSPYIGERQIQPKVMQQDPNIKKLLICYKNNKV